MTTLIASENSLPRGLGAEEAFILHCLRVGLCAAADDRSSAARRPAVDWDKAYEKAVRLGVAPLLYGIMKDRPPLSVEGHIPERFVRGIRMEYVKTWAMNIRDRTGLAEILKQFNAVGIKIILLKGIHLALFVYQDIGFRSMTDVDILISKEDLFKAEELLFGAGYECPELSRAVYDFFDVDSGARERDILRERYKIDHHHLHPFSSRRGVKNLDIHWTLTTPSLPASIDMEGIWTRAEHREMDGTDVLMLCPEDIILHLALHASFSGKFTIYGLRSLCDIAAITRYSRGGIDWDELRLRAQRWKVDKLVYLALRLSTHLLGVDMPDATLRSMEPERFNEGIAVEAARRLFYAGGRQEKIYRPEMFAREIPLQKKVAFIFRRIFPSPQELAEMYSLPVSSTRAYLYYPLRLGSLLYRYSFLYAKFFLYLWTHRRADPFGYDLETYLSTKAIGKR